MRVAAIDIGTNSVLLLIADARDGALVPVLERATITRLGQGVDATRALAPDAVERTLACLASYAEAIARTGVGRVDVVGTSAMRDARGGDALRARARDLLGVEPRVISGLEEAELTFAGSLAGLAIDPARPVTVFDLGGGSTEIIHRDAAGSALRAQSLDIGSVRLTERHVRRDPPAEHEIEAIRHDVQRALSAATAELGGAPKGGVLVGVAGTVTTLAAHAHNITPYDGSRVHGAALSATELAASLRTLAALPLAARKTIPSIEPARADVIVAGAVIASEILAWAAPASHALMASDRGVRWGLAARLASQTPQGAI